MCGICKRISPKKLIQAMGEEAISEPAHFDRLYFTVITLEEHQFGNRMRFI